MRVEVMEMVMRMWRVYREVARERLGVAMPEGAEVWRYTREEDARWAFRRAVNSLLEDGFHLSPDVFPQDVEGVEEFVGLESEDGMALVVLSREEELA